MTIRQGNKIIAGNINVEDYNTLQNKPQINSVELSGNKTLEELGIQASGDYALKSEIELKADKADTLDGYGITDGLSTSQITNCITKIPQDIKLELTDGTLTLKAGSKVYIPNGVNVYDEVVIDKDYVPAILDASNGRYVIFYRNDKQVFGNMSINVCFSGDGSNIPAYSNMYYNIKDNVLKYCNTSGPTDYLFSLPLAIINVENNKVASIDQVFNGFGFIGNTIFALPNVEGLIPNGRNADGSLNNIKFTTTKLSIVSLLIEKNYVIAVDNLSNIIASSLYTYDYEKNIVYRSDNNKIIHCFFADNISAGSTGKITSFSPKNVFTAVDRNDTEWASTAGKPSNKYIDINISSNGSTYNAPANGWFNAVAQNSKMCNLHKNQNNENLCIYNMETSAITDRASYIPVLKGDTVTIYYDGTLSKCRFIYDEGSK